MCTVNNEDGSSFMERGENLKLSESSVCKKCSEKLATVILRKKDLYCRECFLVYATHKFRAALGKSKMVKQGDRVLIGFSGNASSMTMVHQINCGIGLNVHKRLVFNPFIVYVDEGAAFDVSIEERKRHLKEVSSLLGNFNIPAYVSSVETLIKYSAGRKSVIPIEEGEIPTGGSNEVTELFLQLKSLTSKQDLLSKLRNKVLLNAAMDLQCNKVVTAETLVDTASRMLSNIALGRGAQLPLDIGFCDDRQKDIKVLRPVQDFGSEEIEYYNNVHELTHLQLPTFKTDTRSAISIQKLTKTFVTDLQENFPSTVSTVYRTGSKVCARDENMDSNEHCSLCQGPLDTSEIQSSSLQATQFSSLISTCGPSAFSKSDEEPPDMIEKADRACNGEGCNCASKAEPCISKEQLMQSLCYGCRLIAKEVDSIDALPRYVTDCVEENTRLRQMKEEIKDFLL